MLLASTLTSLLCRWVHRAVLGTTENSGLFCAWARAVALHTLGSIRSGLWHKALEQQSRDHGGSLYEAWADTSRSLAPDSTHLPALLPSPIAQRGARSLGSSPAVSPGSPGCAACWSMAGACGSSGTWEEATTSCLDVMHLTPRCLLGSFRHIIANPVLAEQRGKSRS